MLAQQFGNQFVEASDSKGKEKRPDRMGMMVASPTTTASMMI